MPSTRSCARAGGSYTRSAVSRRGKREPPLKPRHPQHRRRCRHQPDRKADDRYKLRWKFIGFLRLIGCPKKKCLGDRSAENGPRPTAKSHLALVTPTTVIGTVGSFNRLPSAHCNHGKRHQQGAGPARRCQNGRRITTICNPRKLQELELDLKKNQQNVEAIAKDMRTAADRLAPDGETYQQEWEGKSHVGAHGRRESRIAMGGQGPRPAMRAA